MQIKAFNTEIFVIILSLFCIFLHIYRFLQYIYITVKIIFVFNENKSEINIIIFFGPGQSWHRFKKLDWLGVGAALSSATQHTTPPELGGKWGMECLNTRFPLLCVRDTAWSWHIFLDGKTRKIFFPTFYWAQLILIPQISFFEWLIYQNR